MLQTNTFISWSSSIKEYYPRNSTIESFFYNILNFFKESIDIDLSGLSTKNRMDFEIAGHLSEALICFIILICIELILFIYRIMFGKSLLKVEETKGKESTVILRKVFVVLFQLFEIAFTYCIVIAIIRVLIILNTLCYEFN
ncbi:unnamed protein product (mitochondrion) [Parajaminaea phylloscopi]|uniref:Uncharacterized protein n=1 Tax=Parajaminaea phylloscopi TaxID=1463510 RepID=A0AB39A6Y5_9BASI